jgi:PAS domain S-box-containing protein
MNKQRLLIVEDEAIVAADLQARLTNLGYDVVGSVPSGEEALVLAGQLRPDLVLMDIHLQGAMDGIDAARELRARLRLPVIFISAYADGLTVERAKMVEPLGYIIKPFMDRELDTIIEISLYKHCTERRLRESEDRHRTILQTAMDGFWLADMEGNLLEVNDTYSRMSGYPASELLAMGVASLEADETAADIVAHIRKVVDLGEDRFESRHRRKDGSVFDVEVSIKHWPSAEGGRLVVFLRDITARQRFEAERAELEEKNRQLLHEVCLLALNQNQGASAHHKEPS